MAAPKLALITGASKGIGRATALHLASLNYLVVVNYASDAAPADALVAQLGADRAVAIKADAGNVAEISRLVDETLKWGVEHGVVGEDGKGKIDVLIPNAADGAAGKSLDVISEADFERVVALNIRGPLFLVQKAAPYMTAGGRVILISTSLCNMSSLTPNYLLYVTSKGAIEQMVRVMAKDLGRRHMTVNCIAPGPIGTELFFHGKSDALIKQISSSSPSERLGKPEEVAAAIGFLTGEGGSWVNGQVLRVNGGMTV